MARNETLAKLKAERIRREVRAAMLDGARAVRGLFKKPGEEGYNPDAELPWKEATARTRAALILTQGAMADERAAKQAPAQAVFGVVVMPQRLESADEWERRAAALNGKVIDVANDAVSKQVLLGSGGPVGTGPQELGADVREEEAEAVGAGDPSGRIAGANSPDERGIAPGEEGKEGS